MAEKKYPTSKITFQGIGKLKGIDGYTAPVVIYGCTDPVADNYDSTANTDDGSCTYTIYGCMDEFTNGVLNINYNPLANTPDPNNPCIPQVFGCMDDGDPSNYQSNRPTDWPANDEAANYDATLGVNTSDGSCTYWVYGCTDDTALNYDILATKDDGSCIPVVNGCMDDGYCTDNPDHFDPNSTDFISSSYHLCEDASGASYNSPYPELPELTVTSQQVTNGFINPLTGILGIVGEIYQNYAAAIPSMNYDAAANVDDASCNYSGCTDATAANYNALAQIDDGSCTYSTVYGCTVLGACNYDSNATHNQVSSTDTSDPCIYQDGCTDPAAFNYDSNAVCDDGSCITTLPNNNIPICDILKIYHSGTTANWLNNGSNQKLHLSANSASGSYPPKTIQISIDYGTTEPNGDPTITSKDFPEEDFLNGSSAWHTYSNAPSNALALEMPRETGTLSCTYTFNWENGNGGTVIHTEVVTSQQQPNVDHDIVNGCLSNISSNYQLYSEINYDGVLQVDSNGNLLFPYQTQANPVANWQSTSVSPSGNISSDCIGAVNGCMDTAAINYFAGANYNSGDYGGVEMCIYVGCTDDGTNPNFPGRPPNAQSGPANNYDPNAGLDDGSCTWSIPQAFNLVTPDIVVLNNTTNSFILRAPTLTGSGITLAPISGVYSHSIRINLATTMSAYRDPALYTPGTFPNEPYTTTFEYAEGSGTQTQFPLISTYQGNTSLGLNVVFSSNIDSIGNFQVFLPQQQPLDSSAINTALNESLNTTVLNNGASTPNTSAIFQNPSDIFTDVPGYGFAQLNLEGNIPVQADYGSPGANVVVAHIPLSGHLLGLNQLITGGTTFNYGPGPWYYVFRVATTDSIGDTEAMIYWVKTSVGNPPETGSFLYF